MMITIVILVDSSEIKRVELFLEMCTQIVVAIDGGEFIKELVTKTLTFLREYQTG